MDPFVGELRIICCQYAPMGWALCQGQHMPIQQYSALFNLIGFKYGGDGNTYFNLPDLRGRVPIGFGQGAGITPKNIASTGGETTHTLTISEMPSHSHTFNVGSTGNIGTPQNNFLAIPSYTVGGENKNIKNYTNTVESLGSLNQNAMSASGSSVAHDNMQPNMTLSFCIAIEGGIFPVRQ